MQKLNQWGPMTVLLVLVVAVVVLVGGVVAVVNPDSLSFDQYLDSLTKAAVGIGVLGVGRGILGAGEKNAQATTAKAAVELAADAANAPRGTVEGAFSLGAPDVGVNDAGEDPLTPEELEAIGDEETANVSEADLPSDAEELREPPPHV